MLLIEIVIIIILLFIFFILNLNNTVENYQSSNNNSNLVLVEGKKKGNINKGKGKGNAKNKVKNVDILNYGMAYPYKKNQNIHTTNFNDCLKNGFCDGLFESKIPKDYQEYSIINYSDKESNQRLSSLNQLANKNANLAVGDKNYTYQPPPKNSTFT